MNTKIIGLIILILVVIGAIMLGMSSTESTNQSATEGADAAMMENTDGVMATDDAMMVSDEAMMEKGDAMMEDKDGAAMEAESGMYAQYSEDKLSLAAEGDVVLFFKASWCPSCRTLDKNIRENVESIPAGVTILEIDFDDSAALKQKYGVTSQHTLVQVDENGDALKKWLGGNTLEATLAQVI